MVGYFRHLGISALVAGACLAGCLAFAVPAAQAQEAGYVPPRVDVSYTNYQPPYPASAQANGESGSVILDVQVGSSGRVRAVRVHTSSGFADLDNAAEEGVLNWHFIPASQNGETYGSPKWAALKIDFQLPGLAPASNVTPTPPAH